jgi:ABC-type polar amino acid transport system ATPase subunit
MGFARNTADQVVLLDRGDPKTFFDNPPQERTRRLLDHILTAT